ncbi:MAG: glutamine synthetase III [Clostridia bacterium]|nr:glutamine synthetase III [Clostridia bacterium]
MSRIPEIFGSLVFNETAMKEKLPHDTYKALKKTVQHGKPLDINLANEVANGMKEWALEKGATHFTHWFQPMTGITAEKHDSFIAPAGNGKVIMDFSGKELIKGESDASSFPSGGLRATFEARGYTAWDPSSYAFIKDRTLCIPTAFCSYSGHALDKKTPLLRSMDTINKQVLRVLRLLGDDTTKSIRTTVGAEQEYFLIKKDHFKQRKDLIFTGRTLFGAKPPKGQELDDHYFGAIKPCVLDFMSELDDELWKLGILAKTEHNEAAPAQHELAPIFDTTNIATDHNQLTMEIMKKIAYKHDLTCLLHEKPFAGVNGSGKHNNWSIITDSGENLFEAGDKPESNTRFLLFLAAVIKAVDEYQDLLRISVASAGNDHRLGGGEAPPAIMSIFIGDELGEVVNSIIDECEYLKTEQGKMALGAKVIPQFKKDTTDRNRTSPFAFTGNKFEFRMLGSAFSVSGPNFVLNTIVAEVLSQFADYMETMDDLELATSTLISNVFKNHNRIIFNGNNYSKEWVKEAEKRGLLNLKSTADALPYYITDKNVQLFEKHRIFTKDELYSRYEILTEMYCKTLNIEALTMIDMVKQDIIPAVSCYANDLCVTATNKKQLSLNCKVEESVAKEVSDLSGVMYNLLVKLEDNMSKVKDYSDYRQLSEYYRDVVIPSMNDLREVVDALEVLVGTDYWPYPSYAEMLFYI